MKVLAPTCPKCGSQKYTARNDMRLGVLTIRMKCGQCDHTAPREKFLLTPEHCVFCDCKICACTPEEVKS